MIERSEMVQSLQAGHKQFYTEWSHSEDLALFKEADSNDYSILI